ncbi:MAG: hypothetical protein Q4B99_05410 [Clostridia bacterium]|nr:hypothetical protein [Clostridia bacterium]
MSAENANNAGNTGRRKLIASVLTVAVALFACAALYLIGRATPQATPDANPETPTPSTAADDRYWQVVDRLTDTEDFAVTQTSTWDFTLSTDIVEAQLHFVASDASVAGCIITASTPHIPVLPRNPSDEERLWHNVYLTALEAAVDDISLLALHSARALLGELPDVDAAACRELILRAAEHSSGDIMLTGGAVVRYSATELVSFRQLQVTITL